MSYKDLLEFQFLPTPPSDRACISFSGGETSALMTILAMEAWRDKCEMVVTFANTGQENEETLEFVDRCDREFGWGVKWLEADIQPGHGDGVRHTLKTFETAHRGSDLFEALVQKYGIPNMFFPHCTRVLKTQAIRSFMRSIFDNNPYWTAIGIRADEFDRVSENAAKNRLFYPLVGVGIQKPDVNRFWSKMPFRLNLKGWEGNCKTCWKKSDRKLGTIALYHPERFECFAYLESKYSGYAPASQEGRPLPALFFRQHRTTDDIKQIPLMPGFVPADDDAIATVVRIQGELFNYEPEEHGGCSESCEAFSDEEAA